MLHSSPGRSQISGSASPLPGPQPAVGTVPACAFLTPRVSAVTQPRLLQCILCTGHRISLSLISRSVIIYPQRDTGEDLLGTVGAIQGICTPCPPCLWLHHQHSQRCPPLHPSMPSSSVQKMLQAVPALQVAQLPMDVLALVRKHPSKVGEGSERWQHNKREREG